MAERAIGFDLGTTFSCVAVIEDKERTIIPNPDGGRITPSVVAITPSGERVVGPIARRQMVTNPENTIYSIKRFMGRRYSEVGEEIKLVSYKVVEGPHQDARVAMAGKQYSPPEISALILQYLKKAAEDKLGTKITKAVITVPAYFNDSQRQATKDAGKIAGLEVLRIINEPTAASLTYGLGTKKRERVVVYDFGGGTFDISIIEIDMSADPPVIEVLATNGDTHLGGDNIDQRIVDWLVSEFKRENGIDLSKDRAAFQRLRDTSEKAKCELSTTLETSINLPFITADSSGPKHLDTKLTRAKLESLVEDLIERCRKPCKQAVEDAINRKGSSIKGIEDIDQIVLVGGMTRMPRIQQLVHNFFGKEPNKSINPDEVVAIGAAIQADVLSGGKGKKEVLLLDVTPLTLGIETLGSVRTPMITRNTTIPTRKSQIFTTAANGQTAVTINVLQGERHMSADNRSLGRFDLIDIPPAPRGVPQIEVSFDIDANGILHVSAKDKGTGKEQSIKITGSSGLSEDEVNKMVNESKTHEAEDKQKKETIETKNQADSLIYSVEKSLKEFGSKISDTDKKDIQSSIENLRKTMSGNDINSIKQAMDALQKASYKLAEEVYKKAGPPPGAAPKGEEKPTTKPEEKPTGEKEEGPIEAEYEVVEEEEEKKEKEKKEDK